MLSSPRGAALPPVTGEDLLWLARAVEAEGEPRVLVAQTLVNRWAWLLDQHPGLFPRLQDLVRAYAQPVNPRWFPGGDLLQKAIAEEPERREVLEAAALRRPALAQRTEFSPATTVAVNAALQGPLSLPAGAVHYSRPKTKPAAKARWDRLTMVPGVLGKSNSIYTDHGAQGVLYSVAKDGPTWGPSAALSSGRPSAGLGVALLGLLAAWAASRSKKRKR
jgi:hypothetical protein